MHVNSLSELDLTKPEGRSYTNIERPWHQEILYFLLVDRFHDGADREHTTYPGSEDFAYTQERLITRAGGTFKGIQKYLLYIKGLGCTTIWLSPVFENDEHGYHGYAIRNFLNTDPCFGTIEELRQLVDSAHALDMRIVLDVVINHTADTWSYAEGDPKYTGTSYTFGQWRNERYPLPSELRNPSLYKKAGAIVRWDSYPETREGDMFELKKLILDGSPVGKEVVELMIAIYSWWIRELDVDGFRLDTVKHIHPEAVAQFCEGIRNYSRYLGKKSFILIGETVGDDRLINRYLKAVRTESGYRQGIDFALDFPMHFILEEVIEGRRPVAELYKLAWWKEQNCKRLNRKLHHYVIFADNHDQIGQDLKTRIGHGSDEKEILALTGILFFLYGIPCLYYGTEQMIGGSGSHDVFVREPMFTLDGENKCFHVAGNLYREISSLAAIRKRFLLFIDVPAERDEISVNGHDFSCSDRYNSLIYFSKSVFTEKLIVLYNLRKTENIKVCVKLSEKYFRRKNKFEYVYGVSIEPVYEEKDGCLYLTIDLSPQQFVIIHTNQK